MIRVWYSVLQPQFSQERGTMDHNNGFYHLLQFYKTDVILHRRCHTAFITLGRYCDTLKI